MSAPNTLGFKNDARRRWGGLSARGKHDAITTVGMFTILKVRDGVTSYGDPGWCDNPPGTLATTATDADLARDGIAVGASGPKKG